MIRFLLVLFTVVVFALLAGAWLIHSYEVRWAEAAVATFAASFLPFPDYAAPRALRSRPAPPAA